MVSLLSHSVMCCGCEVCMLKAGLVTENVIKQTCSDFNCYFGESWDCMSTNLYIFNCSLNIINCKFSYLSKLSLHTFKLLLQELQTKTFSLSSKQDFSQSFLLHLWQPEFQTCIILKSVHSIMHTFTLYSQIITWSMNLKFHAV